MRLRLSPSFHVRLFPCVYRLRYKVFGSHIKPRKLVESEFVFVSVKTSVKKLKPKQRGMLAGILRFLDKKT